MTPPPTFLTRGFPTASALGLLALLLAGCEWMPLPEVAPLADQAPSVGEDEIVTFWGDDLLALGIARSVGDSVPGDVMSAGREMSFHGSSGGDYLGAGELQWIGGRVGGNLRVAAHRVTVTGDVARNATLAARSLDLAPEAIIRGNAYLAGEEVRIRGSVGQHLRVAARSVTLVGSVGGDVGVDALSLRLGPGARIEGDLRYRVPPENVSIHSGAEVLGEVEALEPRVRDREGARRLLYLLWLAGFLLAGSVTVALFPRSTTASSKQLPRRVGASLGLGVGWFVLLPLTAILLAATVVGLPLAFITAAVFVVTLYLGRVVPALWLGRLILGRAGERARRRWAIAAFLVGGVFVLLAGLVPVAGPFLALLIALFGIGAFLLSLREGRRRSNGLEDGPLPSPEVTPGPAPDSTPDSTGP